MSTPPVTPASGARGASLGTFLGVFTPSVLTILGVVLFLRSGWVVGNIGLLPAIAVVVLAHVITFATAFSVSAVATNMHVGKGGAYFMISRSLGLEIGGAIGVPLFLAQTFSLTLYSFGLAEGLQLFWPDVPEASGRGGDDRRGVDPRRQEHPAGPEASDPDHGGHRGGGGLFGRRRLARAPRGAATVGWHGRRTRVLGGVCRLFSRCDWTHGGSQPFGRPHRSGQEHSARDPRCGCGWFCRLRDRSGLPGSVVVRGGSREQQPHLVRYRRGAPARLPRPVWRHRVVGARQHAGCATHPRGSDRRPRRAVPSSVGAAIPGVRPLPARLLDGCGARGGAARRSQCRGSGAHDVLLDDLRRHQSGRRRGAVDRVTVLSSGHSGALVRVDHRRGWLRVGDGADQSSRRVRSHGRRGWPLRSAAPTLAGSCVG